MLDKIEIIWYIDNRKEVVVVDDDLDTWVMKLAGYFTLLDFLLRILKGTKPKERRKPKRKRRRRRKH